MNGLPHGRCLSKPLIMLPKPHNVNIVYTWTLVFLGMVLYTFVWFAMGTFIMTFIDAIVNSFSFSEPWSSTVQFVRMVFLWHPVISLIGWIIYGIINSMKRDVDQWRTA